MGTMVIADAMERTITVQRAHSNAPFLSMLLLAAVIAAFIELIRFIILVRRERRMLRAAAVMRETGGGMGMDTEADAISAASADVDARYALAHRQTTTKALFVAAATVAALLAFGINVEDSRADTATRDIALLSVQGNYGVVMASDSVDAVLELGSRTGDRGHESRSVRYSTVDGGREYTGVIVRDGARYTLYATVNGVSVPYASVPPAK